MLELLIPAAHAQAGQPQDGGLIQLGMIAVLFVVFYFLIIRPQSKRQKEVKTLIENLAVGDEVSTNAGILGKIKKSIEDAILDETIPNTYEDAYNYMLKIKDKFIKN